MSTKAARGTKRACLSCGNKFYDLNRDPITCPICNALFHQTEARPKAIIAAGNAVDDDDDDVIAGPAAGVDIVSLTDVEAEEADLPDLEDNELVDIEEDGAALTDDDEAFIEVEDDDDGGDVTGLVGGGREDDEEV